MDRFWVWLHNAAHFHERAMAQFLRRRGWVVFYLEPRARKCAKGTCWMDLYGQDQKEGGW